MIVLCPLCNTEHELELRHEEVKIPLGAMNLEMDVEYFECPNTGLRKMMPRFKDDAQQEEAAFQIAILLGKALNPAKREELVKKILEEK